jgi:hypothetical protein
VIINRIIWTYQPAQINHLRWHAIVYWSFGQFVFLGGKDGKKAEKRDWKGIQIVAEKGEV